MHKKTLGHLRDRGLYNFASPRAASSYYSRSQLSPQLQFSHPQFSQVQFSQLSPSQSHSSQVQLFPQQQFMATESAAKLLKPRTEAPATTAVAKNFEVIDIIKTPASASSP
jgi:hypothetical protein